MKTERILLIKTLIEVYDRELERQTRLHKYFTSDFCPKCQSLFEQRNKLILELKKEIEGKQEGEK